MVFQKFWTKKVVLSKSLNIAVTSKGKKLALQPIGRNQNCSKHTQKGVFYILLFSHNLKLLCRLFACLVPQTKYSDGDRIFNSKISFFDFIIWKI